MLQVKLYNKSYKDDWDNFIKESKNGSFMFFRDFIEYHSDRFIDHSILIFNNKKQLISVLPANITNNIIHSHQGLTFGGLVMAKSIKLNEVLKIFKSILMFLERNGIDFLFYKKIPHFYNIYNTEEDEYIFFRLKAEMFRVDTSITIDYKKTLAFQKRRKRQIKKAKTNNLKLVYDDDLKIFWEQILAPNLLKKFSKSPVHCLDEIEYLKKRFSKNIIQINVYEQSNEILAGTTLFKFNGVVHAQYISSNDKGKALGAIDFLFNEIIDFYSKEYDFFDFGICNENDGIYINKGLLDWKEGFGARTHIHKFFKIDTDKHILLDD